jgi:hypothetical protein
MTTQFEWEDAVDGYGESFCWRGGVLMEVRHSGAGYAVFVCDGKVGDQFAETEDAKRFAEQEGLKMAIQFKEEWGL